jgi:hypothetical protein
VLTPPLLAAAAAAAEWKWKWSAIGGGKVMQVSVDMMDNTDSFCLRRWFQGWCGSQLKQLQHHLEFSFSSSE